MANIGIIVGSVYGNAQNAAEEAQTFFANQGHEVNCILTRILVYSMTMIAFWW